MFTKPAWLRSPRLRDAAAAVVIGDSTRPRAIPLKKKRGLGFIISVRGCLRHILHVRMPWMHLKIKKNTSYIPESNVKPPGELGWMKLGLGFESGSRLGKCFFIYQCIHSTLTWSICIFFCFLNKYGASLSGPSGRRSSAIKYLQTGTLL